MLQYVDELGMKDTTVTTYQETVDAFDKNTDINLGIIDFNVPGSKNAYPAYFVQDPILISFSSPDTLPFL